MPDNNNDTKSSCSSYAFQVCVCIICVCVALTFAVGARVWVLACLLLYAYRAYWYILGSECCLVHTNPYHTQLLVFYVPVLYSCIRYHAGIQNQSGQRESATQGQARQEVTITDAPPLLCVYGGAACMPCLVQSETRRQWDGAKFGLILLYAWGWR